MTVESRSVVVRLSMEAQQYLATAQAAGKVGADAMDKVGKSAARAADDVGRSAGQLGLLAAAGAAAFIAAGARFDKAMSAVQAATHETTGNMKQLRLAALDAGRETVYSATEAAAAVEELAKAGVSTQNILGGGLKGALDLAAAGNIEVAEAAETAASAMTQFNLAGSDVPHIADLLAAGAGKAQGSVHDLGMALNQAGLVASQTGLSIEETTAALAAFASNGLIGSDAGTSFKTMLLALNPQSKQAAELMDQIGFSAYDAQGQFVGLEEVAARLQASLAGMSQEQRNAALQTLFGRDAIRAANVLYEEGAAGVQKWTAAVDDQGYAAETAATRMDNLIGDLERLRGSLETALIGGGEGAQSPFRGTVQGLTQVIDLFNQLPSAAKGSMVTFAAIGAITGGSVWLGAKVVGKVRDLNDSLTTLSQTSPKTARGLRLLATAGALLVGLEVAGVAIDTIRQKAMGAAPEVEKLTGALLAANQAEFDKEFGSGIVDALDALDKSGIDGIAQDLNNLAEKGGMLGQAAELGLASFVGQGARLNEVAVETGKAAQAFESLDAALSGLVASGGADRARAAFDAMAVSQGLTAEQQEVLLKQLPQYEEALAGAANEAQLGAEANDGLASSMYRVSDGTELTEKQMKALRESYQDQRKAARDTAREFVGLGDSLDDASVSLGDWIKQLEEQAQALRDFRVNAKEAADKGLRQGLIDALEEAGPAGALRMKQLANASEEEIGRANKAWQTGQREIDKYIDATTKVPKELTTTVTVEQAEALADVKRLGLALAGLNDKTIYITTVERTIHQETRLDAAGGSGATHPGKPPRRQALPLLATTGRSTGSGGLKATVFSGSDVPFTGPNGPKYGPVGPTPLNVPDFPFAAQVAAAFRDLALDLADGRKAIRDELADLKHDIKDAGGVWSHAMQAQAQQILDLAKEYDQQVQLLERQQQAMDGYLDTLNDLRSASQAYADQVAGLFNTNPFGQGLDFFDLQISANTGDATAFQQVLQQLIDMGLDGDLFQRLAASGDLAMATQLLATGPAGIALREQAFAAMLAAQQRLGGTASGQVFGAQISAYETAARQQVLLVGQTQTTIANLQTTVDRLEKTLKGLATLNHDVKKATEDGAYKGTRDGIKTLDGKYR